MALEENSQNNIPLESFGWCSPHKGDDPVLISEKVNIIQHPGGRPKQLALRDNKVTDLFDEFIHYQADTEPGSSGAPVYNDQWEIVALHHSGIPERNADGQILSRSGEVWEQEMGSDSIKWKANEGVRLSSILKELEGYSPEEATAQSLLNDLLNTLQPALEKTSKNTEDKTVDEQLSQQSCQQNKEQVNVIPTPTSQSLSLPQNTVKGTTVTIPLNITVSIGQQLLTSTETPVPVNPVQQDQSFLGTPVAAPTTQVNPQEDITDDSFEESICVDPNYDNRPGYDCDFLGGEHLRVPLPELNAQQKQEAALFPAAIGDNPYELKYYHYSVMMNKERRLAYVAAVNIDGNNKNKVKRSQDKWYFDPRLPKAEQIGHALYKKTQFDRGHLVRRLDPAWGKTMEIAQLANDDSFHFTNCSPQHKNFNRGKNLWQGLENYLFERAVGKTQRLTVFTGPVFCEDDPLFREVKIPLQFWKVAALENEQGTLSTMAFIVSQKDLVAEALEEAYIDVARTFQVPIKKVEELTQLSFGSLGDHDVLSVDSFAVGDSGDGPAMPLNSADDIFLSYCFSK
ncbi:MAG: DNA/RNA non-specific endonuclease [Planctomycetes bacterium]|nr:DNA/RNA non-specific endonuclease [Planctomycetota bacterium]